MIMTAVANVETHLLPAELKKHFQSWLAASRGPKVTASGRQLWFDGS